MSVKVGQEVEMPRYSSARPCITMWRLTHQRITNTFVTFMDKIIQLMAGCFPELTPLHVTRGLYFIPTNLDQLTKDNGGCGTLVEELSPKASDTSRHTGVQSMPH